MVRVVTMRLNDVRYFRKRDEVVHRAYRNLFFFFFREKNTPIPIESAEESTERQILVVLNKEGDKVIVSKLLTEKCRIE